MKTFDVTIQVPKTVQVQAYNADQAREMVRKAETKPHMLADALPFVMFVDEVRDEADSK